MGVCCEAGGVLGEARGVPGETRENGYDAESDRWGAGLRKRKRMRGEVATGRQTGKRMGGRGEIARGHKLRVKCREYQKRS